jgi:ribonuclease D
MLDYAAQDTRHLLALSERFRAALEAAGRWHWAREEFDRLEGTQWAPDDPSGAFLRVKGARDLTRRELARLRELVPWRDDLARAMDRSSFRVVSNEVLLDLARRDPQRLADLAGFKGLNPRLATQHGAEITAAIARGNAVPEGELPRFPRSPRWDKDPTFDERVSRLKQVRDAVAAQLDLDPGVLCSRERMEAVVRRNPRTLGELGEVPDVRRWQVEVLGEGFLDTLGPVSSAAESPYRDA